LFVVIYEQPTHEPTVETAVFTGTIGATLAADDRYTTLVTLAVGAALVEALDGEGPLTLFAPTNEAFDALGELPTDPEVIKAILLYHVVGEGVVLEDGLVVETLNGASVLLTVTETETKVNDSNIGETIAASNGIIYVIDAVLLPADEPELPTTEKPVDPVEPPLVSTSHENLLA
jgi:uncharacterized surface protein with fasciclin (FAS1) repeats